MREEGVAAVEVAAAAGAGPVVVGGAVLEHATSKATSAAASIPRIGAASGRLAQPKARVMWVILLEAFGALVLLVFIVWWTMFSGRARGERDDDEPR